MCSRRRVPVTRCAAARRRRQLYDLAATSRTQIVLRRRCGIWPQATQSDRHTAMTHRKHQYWHWCVLACEICRKKIKENVSLQYLPVYPVAPCPPGNPGAPVAPGAPGPAKPVAPVAPGGPVSQTSYQRPSQYRRYSIAVANGTWSDDENFLS